jgi:hypothetical protein
MSNPIGMTKVGRGISFQLTGKKLTVVVKTSAMLRISPVLPAVTSLHRLMVNVTSMIRTTSYSTVLMRSSTIQPESSMQYGITLRLLIN